MKLPVSYSCTPNIKQVIDNHNKTILKKSIAPDQDHN